MSAVQPKNLIKNLKRGVIMKISNIDKTGSGTAGISKYTHPHFGIIALILTIVLTSSSFYLHFSWSKYQNIASAEAVMLAESLESLLHPDHITELSGNEEDLQKQEYTMLKLSLMRLVKTTNPIRFAYLMGERNGNIVILMDSESSDSPEYSPPGQLYSEANQTTWEPFRSGNTVLSKPITDRWGTWISVLVPIKNPSNGSVIAVLGIDYPDSLWNLRIWRQMIPDIIIVLCLGLLVYALFRSWNQGTILKKLGKKLEYDEALYHSIFTQAPIGIAIVNDKSFVRQSEFGHTNINTMFEKILGWTSQELERKKWTEITFPEDLQADLEKFEQFKNGEINGYSLEKRFIKPDGSVVWTDMVVSPLLGESGSVHLCLLEDISKRKETEKALIESERSKSVLLSNLPGLAYRCKYDSNWTMLFVSEGCLELTGYAPESLLHNREISFNDIISPEYRILLDKEWKRILPQRLPFKYEYEITTAQGERKWVLEMGEGVYDEQGSVEALEGIVLDISDRKKFEDNLRYNNEHDAWTGLHNRRFLENLLKNDAAIPFSEKRALISINLNAMYLLSLRYGFHYSQALIQKIANELRVYCNENCMLFSSYEYRFVFYVTAYEDKEDLMCFCEKIENVLESLLSSESITAGLGIVEIDDENKQDIEMLLKNLLIASEKAIHAEDQTIRTCFFNEEMSSQIAREQVITYELSRIASGENIERLFLQYQPILDVPSNRICGFEALARLNCDDFGLVSPLEFIPIAEKSRLIVPLGEIIIRKALEFLKAIQNNGHYGISVSINISGIQLLQVDFVKNLLQQIEETNVNPSNIGLELTESIFTSNYEEINATLAKLKSCGMKIAIDDFGTGYSSLARERELNANCLKIDKFFIDKLLFLSDEEAITGDIISMAHKLGHCVIAEGVEDERQLNYLKHHGCDKIQGYLIGKPLSERDALEIIEK